MLTFSVDVRLCVKDYKKSCKYDEMSAISLLGTTSLIPSTFLLFTNPNSYNKQDAQNAKHQIKISKNKIKELKRRKEEETTPEL